MSHVGQRKILYYPGRNRMRGSTRPYARSTPKPPHGFPTAGRFAHLYSGDILYDPGSELYAGNQIGDRLKQAVIDKIGIPTFVLPRYDSTAEWGSEWPNGVDVARVDIPQWVQFSEPYVATGHKTDSAWHVCDHAPNIGSFHLIWWSWGRSSDYGGTGFPGNLVPQAPGLPPGYSGRVAAGDLVTFSINVKGFGGYPAAGLSTNLCLFFYTSSGGGIKFIHSGAQSIPAPSSPYAVKTVSSFAPGGAYFVRALVTWVGSAPITTYPQATISVDTGTLSIEAG